MKNDRELLRQIMREDFASFARRAIAETMPAVDLEWNWHLDLIADRLAQLARREISRLLICVPPRSLKSLLCSVAFPAWLLARSEAEQLLCVSYGQPLAEDFARRCRQMMDSPFYRDTFDTRLSPERRAVEQFETTGGGSRISSSVGGTITGRGGDFIIIDDPMKAEDALSETGRHAALNWFRETLISRPNSKKKQRMLVVMQRLHEEDLAGYLLEQGGWEVLTLPAVAIEHEEHHYEIAGRPAVARRARGEPLQPAREPLEILEQLRRDMGSLAFEAQYQQNPQPAEGNLVKRVWFGHYESADLLGIDRVIQSWDTGAKTASSHDYSVCTTWGLKAGNVFLIDLWRGRLEMPELCRKVQELADRYQPERVLIEDKGSGTALLQALRALYFHKGAACVPKGSKIERLHGVTPTIEGGHVHVPRSAPWLDEYLHELCGFPSTKHDDQVDSTSQALHWIGENTSPGGVFEYYRREVEALRARENDETVHLRAPARISHVSLMDGTPKAVGPDGTIWVKEINAAPLMRSGFVRLS